jgi:hypothetical protein
MLPPPWCVSQTISSVAPAASAAVDAALTPAVNVRRASAATGARTPGSQYQACSRVKMPAAPSMSQSMKILRPRLFAGSSAPAAPGMT